MRWNNAVFSDTKRCTVLRNLGHLMVFDDIWWHVRVHVQAAALRGEARVVNHSSAARVKDGMENKLDAKYLATRERWWLIELIEAMRVPMEVCDKIVSQTFGRKLHVDCIVSGRWSSQIWYTLGWFPWATLVSSGWNRKALIVITCSSLLAL